MLHLSHLQNGDEEEKNIFLFPQVTPGSIWPQLEGRQITLDTLRQKWHCNHLFLSRWRAKSLVLVCRRMKTYLNINYWAKQCNESAKMVPFPPPRVLISRVVSLLPFTYLPSDKFNFQFHLKMLLSQLNHLEENVSFVYSLLLDTFHQRRHLLLILLLPLYNFISTKTAWAS